MYSKAFSNNLLQIYENVREIIESRINEFRNVWENGSEEMLFRELVFCLLTPQSRAKSCWRAVELVFDCDAINCGDESKILRCLSGVRFKYTKAKNILNAQGIFGVDNKPNVRRVLSGFESPAEAREWLVTNIRGIGYKEASHFLRNIGIGLELAILDRHILKNLMLGNVIAEIPKHLSRRRYFDIEEKMRKFSKFLKIPMSHLDLLLWFMETGEVFK